MSETFNNVVSLERYKHVLVLLEFICRYVMRTSKERLDEIRKYRGSLPPRIKAELDMRKRKAGKCVSCPSGRGWYEVDQGRRKYVVNVRDSVSCSCRQYEVSGIPCRHIIKALSEDDKTKKPETLVAGCFSIAKWEECYRESIKPINGITMWRRCKDVIVLPPPETIPKGRQPSNKRRLESWEKAPKSSKKPKRIMTCAKCGSSGHNIRRCQNMVAPAPPPQATIPKRRGRPRKTNQPREEVSPTDV